MDAGKLLYQPHWQITNFFGCCQAKILYRLGAAYITGGTAVAFRKKINRRGPNFPAKTWKPNHLVDGVKDTNSTQSYSHSIPVEVAFCAVLKDMRDRFGGQLWFMCDNVSGRGDTHKGAFSTRNFVKWLEKNKLATTVTTNKTRGNLLGYCVTLKPKLCDKRIKAGCALLTDFRRRVRRPGGIVWGDLL